MTKAHLSGGRGACHPPPPPPAARCWPRPMGRRLRLPGINVLPHQCSASVLLLLVPLPPPLHLEACCAARLAPHAPVERPDGRRVLQQDVGELVARPQAAHRRHRDVKRESCGLRHAGWLALWRLPPAVGRARSDASACACASGAGRRGHVRLDAWPRLPTLAGSVRGAAGVRSWVWKGSLQDAWRLAGPAACSYTCRRGARRGTSPGRVTAARLPTTA